MTPDGIREKFDLYRKWFQTLLVKEFLNLPSKYQDRFMDVLDRFTNDCKKVLAEGKKVKEKNIRVKVEKVLNPDNKNEDYIVEGKTEESAELLRIRFPVSKPKPEVGSIIKYIVFSTDGVIWYSTKEELIIGRKK